MSRCSVRTTCSSVFHWRRKAASKALRVLSSLLLDAMTLKQHGLASLPLGRVAKNLDRPNAVVHTWLIVYFARTLCSLLVRDIVRVLYVVRLTGSPTSGVITIRTFLFCILVDISLYLDVCRQHFRRPRWIVECSQLVPFNCSSNLDAMSCVYVNCSCHCGWRLPRIRMKRRRRIFSDDIAFAVFIFRIAF